MAIFLNHLGIIYHTYIILFHLLIKKGVANHRHSMQQTKATLALACECLIITINQRVTNEYHRENLPFNLKLSIYERLTRVTIILYKRS